MFKTYSSVGPAFEDLYYRLLSNGTVHDNTRAFYNIMLHIHNVDIKDNYPDWRRFKNDYAETEFQWYLSGDRNISEIGKLASIWDSIADKDGNVWSNYGYHWNKNNQLNKIIALLKAKPKTRRAVVLHYDYNELDNYNKDTPCNITLHFQIIHNKLELTIHARSIDLVYGFCNDFYCFSMLLSRVGYELSVDLGKIVYLIDNLHIYEKHFNIHKR